MELLGVVDACKPSHGLTSSHNTLLEPSFHTRVSQLLHGQFHPSQPIMQPYVSEGLQVLSCSQAQPFLHCPLSYFTCTKLLVCNDIDL